MKLLTLMGRGDAAVLMMSVKAGERARNRKPGVSPMKGVIPPAYGSRQGSYGAVSGVRA